MNHIKKFKILSLALSNIIFIANIYLSRQQNSSSHTIER